MTWIKICGITEETGARAAAAAGADAVGFVFWPGSRRRVDAEDAGRLGALLPEETARVGVWVDAGLEAMIETARIAGLTHFQLHGDEPPALIDRLPLPSIKGVRLRTVSDFSVLDRYLHAWALLIEPWIEGAAGGSGAALELGLARDACRHLRDRGYAGRIVLAGGLTPEGVAAALAAVAPDGVDVSSGVETAGRKDPEKIRRFIENVRQERV